MFKMLGKFCVAASLAMVMGVSVAADAAELPKETQVFLKEMSLDQAFMDGIDDELKVPDQWIAAAKKEQELTVLATWDPDQFSRMVKPFNERYPFIKINYSRASSHERKIKTLLAFKEGRFLTDILSGVGGSFLEFEKAGALADLRDIPGVMRLLPEHKDAEGLWVAERRRYWCMVYNTKLVDKKDLPATWDDLLVNPRWRNKVVGISNRPNLWLLMIAGVKGEKWAANYIDQLFNVVKPQVRKEGNNALIGLVIAGEFHAAIPSGGYRVKQYVKKGAPVDWHCPTPAPLAVSEMSILKGNPHPHATKLFVNWFLSREGQLAQYVVSEAEPIHPKMMDERFLPFPDEIKDKPVAFRSPRLLEEDLPILAKIWNRHWDDADGGVQVTAKGVLTDVRGRGRRISLKEGDKVHTARVSDRRTVVKLNDKGIQGEELKVGMTCDVVYQKEGQEAVSIDCK